MAAAGLGIARRVSAMANCVWEVVRIGIPPEACAAAVDGTTRWLVWHMETLLSDRDNAH
jgi:hypothetical protein